MTPISTAQSQTFWGDLASSSSTPPLNSSFRGRLADGFRRHQSNFKHWEARNMSSYSVDRASMDQGMEGGIGGRVSNGILTLAEGSSKVRLEQGRAEKGSQLSFGDRNFLPFPFTETIRGVAVGGRLVPLCSRNWRMRLQRPSRQQPQHGSDNNQLGCFTATQNLDKELMQMEQLFQSLIGEGRR